MLSSWLTPSTFFIVSRMCLQQSQVTFHSSILKADYEDHKKVSPYKGILGPKASLLRDQGEAGSRQNQVRVSISLASLSRSCLSF